MLDTQMIFLKEFILKIDLDKKSADNKKQKLPSMQRVKLMAIFGVN